MKLSLLVICALVVLLIPALRMPVLSGEPLPTSPYEAVDTASASARLTATWPPFACPSWSSYCPQDPTKTPEPTSVVPPYPEPQTVDLPPYPAPFMSAPQFNAPEVRHITCIIIPWFTEDGLKKREVCYPNR